MVYTPLSAAVYAKLRGVTKKAGGGGAPASRLGGMISLFTGQKEVVREGARYLRAGEFVLEEGLSDIPEFVQRLWLNSDVTIPQFPETITQTTRNWCYGNGVTIVSSSTASECWVSSDDRKTFTKVILPGALYWNIKFGNGRFVGLCSGGACTYSITSTDGVNWTKWEQGKSLTSIASEFIWADGVWIATSLSNKNLVWRSVDDGETWNTVTIGLSSGSARYMGGWCNGVWYIGSVGGDGCAMSLDKGLTWVAGPGFLTGGRQSQWATIGDVIITVGYIIFVIAQSLWIHLVI